MTIVACTRIDAPYIYRINTIHAATKRDAKNICATLNANNYLLHEGETWMPHDIIAEYGEAYETAQRQMIKRINGKYAVCKRRPA